MNTAALLLYAAYAVLAFGWRTWLQWRRTGDTGLRIRAPTGTLQWWAKLAFVVAILTGAVAPIAGLAGLGPLRWLDSSTLQATGALITAGGLALMVGNLIAVIGLAELIVASEFQVRYVEEPYRRSVHGSNFDRYTAVTGRFMPWVGRVDHA
jgi:protein-S-isoprenylcysteine O-methyltransferase Ste14